MTLLHAWRYALLVVHAIKEEEKGITQQSLLLITMDYNNKQKLIFHLLHVNKPVTLIHCNTYNIIEH